MTILAKDLQLQTGRKCVASSETPVIFLEGDPIELYFDHGNGKDDILLLECYRDRENVVIYVQGSGVTFTTDFLTRSSLTFEESGATLRMSATKDDQALWKCNANFLTKTPSTVTGTIDLKNVPIGKLVFT